MRGMVRKTAALVFLVCAAAFAQKWTPDTVVKVKPVAEVRVSPDGTRVVYTVSEPVIADDKSEVVRQIWMAKTDASENAQLTFGEKSSNDPHWLPDGSGIVFTSRRSGKPQLYLLRLRGGEAEPLTSGKLEMVAFAISPDGKSIAFTASDVKEDEEKKAKAKEDYRLIDDDLGMRRLYVMPIAAGAGGKREPRKLVSGHFSVGGDGTKIDWSPDSQWIAYERVKSPSPNDWPTADLAIVNADGGEIRAIASTAAAEREPLFSPDGKWLAYVVSDMPPRWGTSTRVQLVNLATAEKKDVAATYDAQPDIARFSADGKRVYVREARGTIDRIYAIDVASNKVVDVSTSEGALGEANLNSTATHAGLAMQALDKPVEAYVTRADRWAPVQVSHVNEAMAKYPAPKTEVVRWKSTDGKEIEGLLTYPLDYAAGKRVPLLLIVHGGPAGVFKQAFLGNYSPFPVAVFAQDGYAVLPDYFGGHYWETYDVWKAHSPIMFVGNVKTPTLLEHGEADERVPISQGYELYNALKLRGVPVRMIVFPRQRHGLTEPKMRVKAAQSSVEWIEKWIPR